MIKMGFRNQNTNTIDNSNWSKPHQSISAPVRQEVTQQQTRTPGLEYIGVFTGAEMKGQGIISQGKKQGQPWTLLRLNFVTGTIENQRNSHFSAFTPLTHKNGKGLQPNQLEFGKEYKVLYNEKPYTNEYGAQVGKQAYMVFEHVLNKQVAPLQPQIQQPLIRPSFQKEGLKQPVNEPQEYMEEVSPIPPQYQEVWDNSTFGPTWNPTTNEEQLRFNAEALTEWMQIAKKSGVFDSEADAKKVFSILSRT
jgi:hypothetical protein